MNINLEEVLNDTKELENIKNDYLHNLKMITNELNVLKSSYKLPSITESINTYISNNEIITENVNNSFNKINDFIKNQINTYSNTNEDLLFDLTDLINVLDNIKNPLIKEENYE